MKLKAMCIFVVLCGGVAADLVIGPKEVVIESLTDRITINVTRNGAALTPAEIERVELRSGDAVYRDMMRVEERDGAVVLVPSQQLSPGVYDLVIDAGEEEAVVRIVAPLSLMPASLSAQAAALDMNEADFRARMAITDTTQTATLPLPSVHYVGQTATIQMDANDLNTYRWFVNGAEIATGTGDSEFTYTFESPGTYVIGYTESAGPNVVVAATAPTNVVAQPAINMTVGVGEPIALTGPVGWDRYEWIVDGALQSTEPNLALSYAVPGGHTIVLTTRRGPLGGAAEVQTLTYNVTVTAP